jgi:hypothetical protein
MRTARNRSVTPRPLGVLAAIVALGCLAAWAGGCSKINPVVQPVIQPVVKPVVKLVSGSVIGKKVIVAPFWDKTGNAALPLDKLFLAPLKAGIAGEDGNARLVEAPEIEDIVRKHRGSLTGLSGVLDLSRKAREAGANALVTGIVQSVRVREGKTGVYGFRSPASIYTAAVSLWVYDTAHGTKVLDKAVEVTMKIARDEDMGTEGAENAPSVEDLFAELVDKAAGEVRGALANMPFTGRVARVEKDKILVRAGRDVGIETGMIFDIHTQGPEMSGVSGEKYQTLGPWTGVARVIETAEGQSVALVIEGGPVREGDSVRVRE